MSWRLKCAPSDQQSSIGSDGAEPVAKTFVGEIQLDQHLIAIPQCRKHRVAFDHDDRNSGRLVTETAQLYLFDETDMAKAIVSIGDAKDRGRDRR